MVATQAVLEGDVKAFLSFPGGFWKKMARAGRGGNGDGTSPSPRVAGGRCEGLCVTGCNINGNVWRCGQRGRGAGHAGECEPVPRGTDVCGMAPCEAILKI